MTFWCYLLHCADGSFYTGHTDDLERRMSQHHAGGFCDYTARRKPVALVWSETFPSRIEALTAERQIKGWSRAKKGALIVGDWKQVSRLATTHGTRPSTSSGRTEQRLKAGAATSPVRPEPVEGRSLSPRSAL